MQRELEKRGQTQTTLAAKYEVDRKTMRKYTRRSKFQPNGCYPHVTPMESPLSVRQEALRVDYAEANRETRWKEVTFFDDMPLSNDGVPNKKQNPQWRRKNSKKPLIIAKKRKFPGKLHYGMTVNSSGGLAKPFVHAKRRKLKKGPKKGQMTFDHISMDAEEMVRCCKESIIPFMKETGSTELRFDCTDVYHNQAVYNVLLEAGIKPYPSAGKNHKVHGGYPPNSHETMPCESVHNLLKEKLFKKYAGVMRSRRNQNTLHNLLLKTAKTIPRKAVADVIANQTNVIDAIIAEKGKRTKY